METEIGDGMYKIIIIDNHTGVARPPAVHDDDVARLPVAGHGVEPSVSVGGRPSGPYLEFPCVV
jgi:hypothetical protein